MITIRKKVGISLIVIVMLAFALLASVALVPGMNVTAYAGSNDSVYTPLSVTGFDADVVADDGSWSDGWRAVNGRYIDATEYTIEDYGHVFVSSSFGDGEAFPAGETISTASGKSYTLQSSTANNALQVARASGFSSKTLTLTTPGSYEKIGVLSTGGGGDASLLVVVHYSDGSQSAAISLSSPDWYGGSAELRVYGPLSRTQNYNPDSIEGTGAYLFETTIAVDPDKAVTGIDFNFNGDNNAVANIFAISGMAAELKHTVTFDLNGHGDTAPAIQKVSPEGKATKPSDPQESGYTFSGWYKEAACQNVWNFDTDTVSANITLYAKWTSKPHEHDGFSFAPWVWTDSLPTSGSYYLTEDVIISATTTVTGTLNLCLNGHSIRMNGSGRIFYVNGGTFALYDCDKDTTHKYTITSPVQGAGLAVVDDEATGENVKTFVGGYITGAKTSDRGAVVSIEGGGLFTLNGGTLIGNTTSAGHGGGAVALLGYEGNRFVMNGGAIIGNTTTYGWGGGVYMHEGASFTMNGGVIKENYASKNGNGCGGGITVEGGSSYLILTGGSIINNVAQNHGGNINLAAAHTRLSGNIIISGGKTPSGADDDVYVNGNRVFEIVGELTTGFFVRLTRSTGAFTSGWTTYMSGKEPADYFVSDDSAYIFGRNAAGEAIVGVPYTVSFDMGGHGEAIADLTVAGGGIATEPNAPTDDLYLFDGWYKETTFATTWDFDHDAVGSNVVLYAKWTPKPQEHDGIIFVAWTLTDSLPTSGSYYLTEDVIISATANVTGTLNLCLNGHGIKLNGSGSVIKVGEGTTLKLYDCDAETKHRYSVASPAENGAGVATVNDKLAGVEGQDYQTFTGGYITGGYMAGGYSYGAGINIEGNGATLYMYGGTIIGNRLTAGATGGGGVCVQDWDKSGGFYMYGGSIIGNTANYGGGVYVRCGKMELFGGNIGKNVANGNIGGAVLVFGGNSTLIVRDGIISNNKAVHGGAFEASGDGTITICGGSITNNLATSKGGALTNQRTDGDNSPANFNISGAPVFSGNTAAGKASDIYLCNTAVLNLTAAMTNTTKIGIAKTSVTGAFTSGWTTYMSGKEPADYFVSDGAQYVIGLVNGEAALLLPMTAEAEGYEGDYDGDAHGITVTPSVTGTTIKYGASADACTFDTLTYANAGTHTIYYEVKKTGYATVKGSATVTISAINLTITITGHNDTVEYDGTKHSVTGFDVADGAGLYTESDLTFSGTAEAKRTDAGTAYMGLTSEMFTNTNTNFATVPFIVTDGYVTVLTVDAVVTTAPAEPLELLSDGEEKVLIVAGEAVGGTLYYAMGNIEAAQTEYSEELPVATEAGTYYIWYKVIADGNHNDVAAVCVKVTLAEPAWVTLNGVIQADNNPVESADVVLMKGNQKVDFVTTAADGAYRFIVPTGVYNVVVKYDNCTETTIVMLFNDEEKNIVLSDGKTESKLEVVTEEGEKIGIAVGGLEEEAQAIREENPNAETVSVVMTVEYKSEEQIEEEPEEAPAKNIQNSAQEKNLEFYEIKVEKTVDQATTILEETANILEIAIPYEKIHKRGLIVYSYHDDSVRTFTESDTKADGTFRVDKENKLIYVYANKFSTYAVGYTPYYRVQTALSLGSYTGKASVTIVSDADENITFTLNDADLNNLVFPNVPKGQYTMTVTWGAGKKNVVTMSLTVGPKTVLSLKTEPEEPEEESEEEPEEESVAPANAAVIDMPEETEHVAEEEVAPVVMAGIGYEMDAPVVAINEKERKKGEEIRALLRKRDDDNE